MAIVFADRAVNFYGLAGEHANVANMTKIVGEDHDGKRTRPVISTELQQMGAAAGLVNFLHRAGDASSFANLFFRLINVDTFAAADDPNRTRAKTAPAAAQYLGAGADAGRSLIVVICIT